MENEDYLAIFAEFVDVLLHIWSEDDASILLVFLEENMLRIYDTEIFLIRQVFDEWNCGNIQHVFLESAEVQNHIIIHTG